jgi:hypothetical protein
MSRDGEARRRAEQLDAARARQSTSNARERVRELESQVAAFAAHEEEVRRMERAREARRARPVAPSAVERFDDTGFCPDGLI